MLKNNLLKFTLFSLFLHLGLFFFLKPVFYSYHFQETRRFFWGSFEHLGDHRPAANLLNPLFYKDMFKWRLEDFSYSCQYKLINPLRKIRNNFIFLKETPEYKDSLTPPLEKTLFDSYNIIGKSLELKVLDKPYFSKNLVFYLKSYSKGFKLGLLISPQGRVIWIRGLGFSSNFQLNSLLEDEVRGLIFSPRGIYYWKNLEIVVK